MCGRMLFIECLDRSCSENFLSLGTHVFFENYIQSKDPLTNQNIQFYVKTSSLFVNMKTVQRFLNPFTKSTHHRLHSDNNLHSRLFTSSSSTRNPSLIDEVHPISRITVYQCDLPLKEGSYNWSQGKSVSVFDSTIISIETETGYKGWSECTPLGSFYLPSYAGGVRSGIKELAPHVLGLNAINLTYLNDHMDLMLKGHPYIKSPIDIACWDILGKITNTPLVSLLGGKQGDSVQLYRAISQQPPKEMSENVGKYKNEDNYTKFQLKAGSTVLEDIDRIKFCRDKILDDSDILVADANTGWLPHEAMRIIGAVKDYDVYIEEPCATYEENSQIRRFNTNNPFIMDECIDNIDRVVKCGYERAADVINLKISKLGGLTKAREVRDLCVRLNIAMCIEDTWGGDIATATIAHLAHSTPERLRFSSTDFNSYNTVKNAMGSPQKVNGKFEANMNDAGLAIDPIMDVLKPIAVYDAKDFKLTK